MSLRVHLRAFVGAIADPLLDHMERPRLSSAAGPQSRAARVAGKPAPRQKTILAPAGLPVSERSSFEKALTALAYGLGWCAGVAYAIDQHRLHTKAEAKAAALARHGGSAWPQPDWSHTGGAYAAAGHRPQDWGGNHWNAEQARRFAAAAEAARMRAQAARSIRPYAIEEAD